MIPIHNRSESQKSDVVIHRLQELTEYDSTQAHRHNYFEFFIFDKGEGSHWIDFEKFPIESKSVHIVAPGQVHQVKRELNTNGFVFLFDLGLFNSNKIVEAFLFDHICLDVEEFVPNYKFNNSIWENLDDAAQKAWKHYQSDSNFKAPLVRNNLTELILYCMESIGYSPEINDQVENDVYLSFRRLLKQEFKHLKKVKEYASELAVTEKGLNDIVHVRSGETVSTLIYKQLILEAKRLLNKGASSKEIAFELNFKDPAHFSKFFKSQTGMSATEFVKVHE